MSGDRMRLKEITKLSLSLLFLSSIIYSQSLVTNNWIFFDRNNSPLPTNKVTAISQDKFGNYWIGCSAEWINGTKIIGGVAKFNGTNWTVFNNNNSIIPENNIEDISVDIDNNVWVATFSGLFKYDGNTWVNINTTNSNIPSNELISVTIAADSSIWVGTYNSGVGRMYSNNWQSYNINSGLCSDLINFIRCDYSNVIWLGTSYGCLMKFQNNNWSAIGSGPFMQSIQLDVKSFADDKNGNHWVSGYHFNEGNILAKFKDTNWTFFDSTHIGFSPFYSYNGIAVDSNNIVWLTSKQGLIKFDGNLWTLYDSSNSPIPANWFGIVKIDRSNNKIMSLRNVELVSKYYGLFFYNENGVVLTSIEDDINKNFGLSISQNFPNPFNPSTKIRFSIPISGAVFATLKCYDILGNEIETIVNEEKPPGTYEVTWYASGLTSGVYFYRLTAGEFIQTKKMILMR